MKHEFRVYGEVRGQGRPRVDFTRRRVYKDKKDKESERRIKEAYINSGGEMFKDVPLAMLVVSHRMIPASYSKKITCQPDIYKPDTSNILKCVEDALNKIAYHDDSQIVCAIPIKAPRGRYANEYIDILITDEFDVEELTMRVKECFK